MFRSIRLRLKTEEGAIDWVWLFCLVLTLFAIQGVFIILFYLIRGVDTPPEALPLGLQLDFVHGIIHLVTGCLAALFAFRFPAKAPIFVRIFAIFYLTLAVFGTFTDIHFGLQLELAENALHWPIGLAAAVIGYGPLLTRGRHGS
ncbi:MAG: DUF4383 domain-containing protein [Chloroflexota bacterium]|jgi:hypothetical protein